MELHMDPSDSPVRAAATVVMLRDGPGGLEVFLLKRHGLSDVLGGAYVFPGGKVDLEDAHLEMLAHLDAPLHALHAALMFLMSYILGSRRNSLHKRAFVARNLFTRHVFKRNGIANGIELVALGF